MHVKNFSIKKALIFGFKKTSEHIALILSIELFFFGMWLLMCLAGATIHGIPDKIADPNFLQKYILLFGAQLHDLIPPSMKGHIVFILSLLAWAIFSATIIFMQGVRRIMLDIYETNTSEFTQLFSQFDILITLMLSAILYILLICSGIVLLVLPALYFCAKYGFYAYCLLDNKTLGPIEAFKESGQLTKCFVNKLCLYNLLWIALLYLSVISWIGWIVIMPALMLSDAYVYRQMTEQS